MRSSSLFDGHEAHLWYVLTDRVRDERLQAAYRELMSPDEIERNGHFIFPEGRHEHLVTRALVRTTLSSYHPSVDPRTWQFTVNQYGRPEVVAPVCQPRISFNLSHTRGMIVCLVAVEREIGVDVEDTARHQVAGVEIADRFFSPVEVAELRSLPAAAQRDRFFDYWTLKESYIKARGLGLQIPLDQFSFQFGTSRRPGDRHESESGISISFRPQIHDDPESWQFELVRLTDRHRLAIAIRRRHEPHLVVRVRSVIPLTA